MKLGEAWSTLVNQEALEALLFSCPSLGLLARPGGALPLPCTPGAPLLASPSAGHCPWRMPEACRVLSLMAW